MKWIILAALAGGLVGCDQTQTTDIEVAVTSESKDPFVVDGGVGGSSSSGSPLVDPCGPYEETLLPAMGLGDTLVVCNSCSDTCADLGDPCASYGASCDFAGVPGVCIACCAEIVGELHCSPL